MDKKLQIANSMNVTSVNVVEEPIDFLSKESSNIYIWLQNRIFKEIFYQEGRLDKSKIASELRFASSALTSFLFCKFRSIW